MRTAKNHWDAIAGLLGNRKRRLSKDERRALEFANAKIASDIVAEMPSDPGVEVKVDLSEEALELLKGDKS